MQIINHFAYEYDWASNFYPTEVWLDDIAYASVEHAYQGG